MVIVLQIRSQEFDVFLLWLLQVLEFQPPVVTPHPLHLLLF